MPVLLSSILIDQVTASAQDVLVRTAVQLACLIGVFFALIYSWNRQFEPVPGVASIILKDLSLRNAPTDSIKQSHDGIAISAVGEIRHTTFELPTPIPADFLYVSVAAQARQLIPGQELWQDGRTYLEWLTPQNTRATVSYLHSARGNTTSFVNYVIKVPKGNLRPMLRVENLGQQGDYLLQGFQMTPAQHTLAWNWLSLAIILACVFLISGLLSLHHHPSLPRRLLAASVTVIIGYFFIIPGPWPHIKGLGRSLVWQAPQLELTENTVNSATHTLAQKNAVDEVEMLHQKSAPLPPQYTKLPEPENLVLRAKNAFKKIRSVLHAVLLFCPVWIACYCVGAVRGFLLGCAMAIGIETAQWLFGYGFQADDIGDLFADLMGICMAVFCHTKLSKKMHQSLPFPFPFPQPQS
jgi:hypothetical protein